MVTFSDFQLAISFVADADEDQTRGLTEIVLGALGIPAGRRSSSSKTGPRLITCLVSQVADPVVTFCETVVETSSLKCFAETPNKK